MKYVPEKHLFQYDQGVYIIVPDEYRNCTAQFYSKSFPDGLAMENEIVDGKILCQIPNQMLVNAESIIVYAFRTGTNIMITESLSKFSVTARPKPPDFVLDPTDTVTYKTASDLITDMQTAKSEEAKRVTAETLRTSAEIERASSETVRKSSETNRANAEVLRVNAETSRSKAETSRVTAEQSRANAESLRASAEQNRTNAEGLRVEAEASREAAEQLRVDAETERAGFYEGFNSDINSLKNDLTNVNNTKADKSELAKTNLYLDALFKLNRGQTWDTIKSENESYSVDVPSGARYAAIDKVGGKSIVWNQKFKPSPTITKFGLNIINNNNKLTIRGTATETPPYNQFQFASNFQIKRDGRKYLYYFNKETTELNKYGVSGYGEKNTKSFFFSNNDGGVFEAIPYIKVSEGDVINIEDLSVMVFDLTTMFGSGNEPSTVKEFEAMFPLDYYPYNEGEIISSLTDRVDVASADGTISQQITTGFPVLNSAGSVYDYIDIDNGKLHQRVGKVDLGTLNWYEQTHNRWLSAESVNSRYIANTVLPNILAANYSTETKGHVENADMQISIAESVKVILCNRTVTTAEELKASLQGEILYYELAEPIVTDIEIPTDLTEWLTVEAGGTITFHNADDGKSLLIPNKETFVRKLDEVM